MHNDGQLKIAIKEILIDGNHRRKFDKIKMAELTESVKKVGVLEPILVRPNTGGSVTYRLISGARRIEAAMAAGLKEIPSRVMEVDMKAAAEIQLLENLHREDLTPLDEANAFKFLLEGGKHTVESLAGKVDKSTAYVYRALKLLELPNEALLMLEAGEITPAHGHQILRAPAEKREELTKFVMDTMKVQTMTVRALQEHITYHYGADLVHAIFPKGRTYAGELACTACPYNSGNQGNLFDGAEKGRCLNTDCFKRKTGAFIEEYSKSEAANNPGLQYLGLQAVDFDGNVDGMRRAVVAEDVSPKLRKLIKENPDKFGWCVLAPQGKPPSTAVVCLDKRLLAGPAAPRAPQGSREGTARGPGRPSERDLFIEKKVSEAVDQAVNDCIPPRTRFDFDGIQWGILAGVLGFQVDDGGSDRIHAQALLRAAVGMWADPDEAIDMLGVKREKIEAAARKTAEADWVEMEKVMARAAKEMAT